MDTKPITARLGIAGVLECRDADGNVIKTIELLGSLPLTDEQAQQLQGATDGTDDSE